MDFKVYAYRWDVPITGAPAVPRHELVAFAVPDTFDVDAAFREYFGLARNISPQQMRGFARFVSEQTHFIAVSGVTINMVSFYGHDDAVLGQLAKKKLPGGK